MRRTLPNQAHTWILAALLAAKDHVKSIAVDHGVTDSTVRKLAARHQLSTMLVLPAERAQLLRQRGKA